MVTAAVRTVVGGILYLGAVWGFLRLGLVQSPTPVAVQWIYILAPAVLYGLLAGSWWALLGPAVVAGGVLLTGTTPMENSDFTWGEVLAPVIFFPSAIAVAVGVVVARGWRAQGNAGAD